MKALHIIWMFAAGLAAALALVAFWLGSGAAVPIEPSRQPQPESATRVAVERAGTAARDSSGPDSSRVDASGLPGALPHAPAGDGGVVPGASPGADAGVADAVAAELRRMSAGYRNRIFLHAIRERGHYCTEILDTLLGDGDVGAWRVACTGMNAFLISVASSGELVIEPLYYGDRLGPAPMPFSPQPPQQRFVVPE